MQKKRKKENIKLFKLLNDEIFWNKFINICLSPTLVKTIREKRSKKLIPRRDTLNKFIEDYKIITWDERENQIIKLELLSVENE